MNDQEVLDIIIESFAEEFELDRTLMTSDAHLVETLGLDSLDFVDMVLIVQNRFGVSLREDPRVRQVRTLGDIHALVLEIMQETGGNGREDGPCGDGSPA